MSVENLISIVLPVFEDQKNLNRILADFQKNKPDDSWELIVVDDGSPKTLELPENKPENWQIIRHDLQRGAATARNTGVRKARGKHVIMLSVFLKIPEDYISKIKRFLTDQEFDFAQHLLIQAPELAVNHFQQFLGNHRARLTQPAENLAIKQSVFVAAVVKKESFCMVKGFDETMQHYGGHEMDLIFRLDQAGFKKRVLIENLPLQRMQLGSHIIVRNRLREYGNTGLPNLLKKHPSLKKTILINPWVWTPLSILGFTRLAEKSLFKMIEDDKPLAVTTYRLYLHLIMRNAWDAR